MSKIDDLKTKARNLPRFSEKDYNIASYIVAGDADNISGTAQSGDGKELKVTLHKK